jgi:hypothetical protein
LDRKRKAEEARLAEEERVRLEEEEKDQQTWKITLQGSRYGPFIN